MGVLLRVTTWVGVSSTYFRRTIVSGVVSVSGITVVVVGPTVVVVPVGTTVVIWLCFFGFSFILVFFILFFISFFGTF